MDWYLHKDATLRWRCDGAPTGPGSWTTALEYMDWRRCHLNAKIKELQEEIKKLQAQEAEIAKERDDQRKEAWKAIQNQREWSVIPHSRMPFMYIQEGDKPLEGAIIQRRVKEELYAAFKAEWGKTSDDNRWEGMFYYRTDEGILHHGGGGLYVLKTPKLCSDEEWAAIMAGNIPDKFKI